jgi:hypothetical protein
MSLVHTPSALKWQLDPMYALEVGFTGLLPFTLLGRLQGMRSPLQARQSLSGDVCPSRVMYSFSFAIDIGPHSWASLRTNLKTLS